MKKLQNIKKKLLTSKRKNIHLLLFIVIISFIVFSPVLNNEFLNIDDEKFITNNELIKSLDSEQVSEIFKRHHYSPWYKPLVYLSWATEYEFFGLNSSVFHINNLLLHTINSIFVFFIMLIIFKKLFAESKSNKWLAFLVAILFALHPMKVESVAWAMERKDVLFSFFFLSSLLCYIRYTLQKKYSYVIIGSLLFGLGLLSKSMIISLPFVLFIIDYLFKRKFHYKLFLEKIPYLLMFLFGLFLYGIFSNYGTSLEGLTGNSINNDDVIDHSVFERFIVSFYRLFTFLSHLLFPSKLSIVYPLSVYPIGIDAAPLKVYTSFAAFMLIIGLSIYFRKYTRTILASLLFFMITIFPVLGMSGASTSNVSDRYTYIASISIFLLFGLLVKYLLQRFQKQKIPIISLTVLIVLSLSFSTHQRCKVYSNSLTLWDDVIEKYDGAAVAYNNRGTAKKKLNDLSGAMKDFNKAIQINPNNDNVFYNRGIAKAELNDLNGAIDDFNMAIKNNPNYVGAYINRGNTKKELNNYEGALKDFNKAIEINPKHSFAFYNRGFMYYDLNNFEEAVKNYNKAVEINPKYSKAYNNRGLTKINMGDFAGALYDFTQAVKIDSDFGQAYFNRARLKMEMRDYDSAILDFSRSIKIEEVPNESYMNRGIIYYKKGNYSEALKDYNSAIKLVKNNPQYYINRGLLYKKTNSLKLALQDFEKAIELNPKYANSYRNRADVYTKLGNIEKAKQDIEIVKQLEGKIDEGLYNALNQVNSNNSNSYLDEARKQISVGNISKAMELYNKAIETDNQFADAYFERGSLKGQRMGDIKGALIDFNKAIQINPDDKMYYLNRGIVHSMLKNNTKSLEDYNRALELDKNLCMAYNNRAGLLLSINQKEKAKQDIIKAQSLGCQVNPKLLKLIGD